MSVSKRRSSGTITNRIAANSLATTTVEAVGTGAAASPGIKFLYHVWLGVMPPSFFHCESHPFHGAPGREAIACLRDGLYHHVNVAQFRLTDHEADLGLEVEAATEEELFSEAARGLTACHTEVEKVRDVEMRVVEVKARTRAELLVRWLKEWLYLQESEAFLVRGVRMKALSATRAAGEGWGERRDAGRHRIVREVKAVTYHQARVERRPDGWFAQVIVDV